MVTVDLEKLHAAGWNLDWVFDYLSQLHGRGIRIFARDGYELFTANKQVCPEKMDVTAETEVKVVPVKPETDRPGPDT